MNRGLIAGQLIGWIKNRGVEYRKIAVNSIIRNRHMNNLQGQCSLSQDEIDALLTDFINFCGVHQGIDYAMYADDFAKDQGDTQINVSANEWQ